MSTIWYYYHVWSRITNLNTNSFEICRTAIHALSLMTCVEISVFTSEYRHYDRRATNVLVMLDNVCRYWTFIRNSSWRNTWSLISNCTDFQIWSSCTIIHNVSLIFSNVSLYTNNEVQFCHWDVTENAGGGDFIRFFFFMECRKRK